VLLSDAVTRVSCSLTGLLIGAVPIVGAVLVTSLGDHDRLSGRAWLGLCVGLLGVAAIVGLDVTTVSVLALVEVAGVAVCYATGPIILSRNLRGTPVFGVVSASLVVTALVYAPFAATRLPSSAPSTEVIWSVVGLAVVCTALAFVLFFALIAEVGPVRATVITYVNPAVAAVLGVTLLDESLTVGMVVGFALVLAGSVLATGHRRPEAVAES
jgi:drug/metabolite transporter (DMT)-like permease